MSLELVLKPLQFPSRKYTFETADANSLVHKFQEVSFQDWPQWHSPIGVPLKCRLSVKLKPDPANTSKSSIPFDYQESDSNSHQPGTTLESVIDVDLALECM